MDIEDLRYRLLRDRRERYDLRQTSKELGAEITLHDIHQFVVLGNDTAVEFLHDLLCADVRGKEDQGVREITYSTQTVMQLTFVKDLQEQVEDRLVSFLYLIEKHHRVRCLADLIDQQTTLFVTYISRRRSVQQSDRVLLLELRHIESQQRTLVAEEELRQCFRQLRLTGSRRTKEEERTHRLTFLVQTRTSLKHSVQHFLDRMVLSYHTFLELFFTAQQTVTLLCLYLTQRNTSLFSYDGGHILGGQIRMFLLCIAEVILYLHMRHSAVEQVNRGRWQTFLGQVAFGKADRLRHHLFAHLQTVVLLVRRHDTFEDLHRQIGGGLLNHDAL